MNENPTPSRPDDDASDPLLTALRQRLGDYGEAPPPGAWAGIRQRLPAPPAARPWWQTRLPLLAVLLGLVAATGLVVRRAWQPEKTVATDRAERHTIRPASSDAGLVAPTPGSKLNQTITSTLQVDNQTYSSGNAATSTKAKPSLPRAALTGREVKGKPAGFTGRAGSFSPVRLKEPLTATANSRQKRLTRLRHGLPPGLTAHRRPASRAATATQQCGLSGRLEKASALRNTHRAAGRRNPFKPKPGAIITGRPMASGRKTPARMGSSTSLDSPELKQGIDSLIFTSAALALSPRLALPAPLAAGADSSRTPYPPVQRWSLLALAGPTLSYRTIGPAPATTTGHPDFAHLERPALGLGAQVQARRVLSGRWALAVGVGYQEYATRLALQLADSGATRIHQRDTYRLLTLPVQLGYALGAPRGRLAKGLLLGAEVGWYRGGRSTEGSDCGCQQQTYSASSSPYRPWSLALSLGLDLRYRVGGPASRWQWVVQPTGRYVLSPFVRPETGFSPRHPFSLGVLTGFSWDIR